MNDNQSLTTRNISIKLIALALLLPAANLLQSPYGLVDMMVVGRIVGGSGLAAINNTSMISFIISSICTGITMGGTALTTQHKGAKDEYGRIETIEASLIISLIAAALVTAAGLSAYEPLSRMLDIPTAAVEDACGYMRITCFGTVFAFGYNAIYFIPEGWEDVKSPPCFVAVATAVNIALDLPPVGPFDMGTKGAVCVTTFSQGTSFAVTVIHLKRKNFVFDSQLPHFSIKTHRLAVILKVGLPAAVQVIVVNLFYPLITGMLSQSGVSVAVTSGVGLKTNTFTGMLCWAIGQVVTAMAGQNIGAGDTKRVRKATKIRLCLNLFITFTMALLAQAFEEQLVLLLTPVSLEMITGEILYLRICYNVNNLVYVIMHTFNSFAIGIGSVNIAMINALLDMMIVRLPVSWFLALPCGLGFPGMYVGQALSPLLFAVVGLLYFKSKGWKNKWILRQHSRIYHTKI